MSNKKNKKKMFSWVEFGDIKEIKEYLEPDMYVPGTYVPSRPDGRRGTQAYF